METSGREAAGQGEGIWRSLALGEKLKLLRSRRRLTQEELADAADITQATISRLERGQIKELSRERLERLARALEVPLQLLLGGSESTDFTPRERQRTVRLIARGAPEKGDDLMQLVHIFRRLSPVKRAGLIDFALFLSQQDQLDSEEQLVLWLDEQEKGGAE